MNEEWYEVYKSLYGNTFNRNITIGTKKEGFTSHNIRSLDQLKELIDKNYPQKEFYITLYDFKTDANLLKWNRLDTKKYEKYAIKNHILLRFREDTTIIQQETQDMNEVKKYMFIRRSINLGSEKKLLADAVTVSKAIEELFGLESYTVYNGFDEIYLYLFFEDEIELENPASTLYYLNNFIREYTEVKTLTYKKIEPFSQIVSLPGTQKNSSRLYVKPFNRNIKYTQLIDNCSKKEVIDKCPVNKKQNTTALKTLLETIDAEITKKIKNNSELKTFDLNKLFYENKM